MGKITKIVLGISLLIILIIGSSSVYQVRENEFAYRTRFSKYQGIENTAGLKYKVPFIEDIQYLPKHRMMYDIPKSEVITADKKTLVVDNYTVWQINEPLLFMRTVGSIPEMENRIDASVYNAVKNTLGTMEQTTIINSDNGSVDEVNEDVTKIVNQQLTDYGVSIVSVEIKRLDLPTNNQEAVYTRMVSERNQMAESYLAEGKLEANKIKNETDKQVIILISEAEAKAEALRGEGEKAYMEILSEAYNSPSRQDYYKFVRSLESLEKTMKGEKTIFLPMDSYIGQSLQGLQ
jgi:membrane protease subunit HflC